MESEFKQELTLQEIQSIEFHIMKYIHKICEENNLTYYLYGGTLLGAVRHKGFIPWDDDLDIIVPRNDYDTLIRILNNRNEFRLLSFEYVNDYYYPFAKLVDPTTKLIEIGVKECSGMGVWVDIFPLDGTPRNSFFRFLHTKMVKKLVGLNQYLSAKQDNIETQLNTPAKRIRYSISKLFKSHTVIKLANKLAGVFHNNNSEMVLNAIWGRPGLVYKSEWFGKPVLLPFEGELFFAPSNYNSLLTCVYGDYMKPPPEDKRYSGHSYSCWRI